MVAFPFNSFDYQPAVAGGNTVYPSGTYTMIVVGTKEQNASSGKGKMLVFDLKIVDGQFKDGSFVHRLNVQNENTDAQRIARQELSAIARVVGVPQFNDTQQLHSIPFKVTLVEVPNVYIDNNGKEVNGKRNNVTDITDINNNKPMQSQGPNTPANVGNVAPQPASQGFGQQQGQAAPGGGFQGPAQQPAPAQGGFQPAQQQGQPGGFQPPQSTQQAGPGSFPGQTNGFGQQQAQVPQQQGFGAPTQQQAPQQGGGVPWGPQ